MSNKARLTALSDRKRDSSAARRFLIACLISCVLGSTVAGLALASAWQTCNRNGLLRYAQLDTQWRLKRVGAAIYDYRLKHHSFPRSLSQLRDPADDTTQRSEVDGWNRPFVYTVRGSDYRVVSYGRDAKPGGTGDDADLSNIAPRPPEATLPFREFFFHPQARLMVETCVVAGVLAFFLSLALLNPTETRPRNYVGYAALALKLLVTLGATLLVAAFLAALDQPSGH